MFQLVKPFFANLYSSTVVPTNTHICRYGTQWPQTFFLFAYEYPKYAEFHADFKSVGNFEKRVLQKFLIITFYTYKLGNLNHFLKKHHTRCIILYIAASLEKEGDFVNPNPTTFYIMYW